VVVGGYHGDHDRHHDDHADVLVSEIICLHIFFIVGEGSQTKISHFIVALSRHLDETSVSFDDGEALAMKQETRAGLPHGAGRLPPMPNIFLLYMPPGNAEAMIHYEQTIHNGISLDRISRFLPEHVRNRLRELFGDRPIAVWGSRNSPANRGRFEVMQERDNILIVEGPSIRLMGLVAAKLVSPELSRELWRDVRGNAPADGWDLIYFIANPREIGLPFAQFCRLVGYQENLQLRGFTRVGNPARDEFYARYDNLYDVLIRLRNGEEIEIRRPRQTELLSHETRVEDVAVELTQQDVEAVLDTNVLTDHVRMQWTLTKLGIKAGMRVWVPRGDQTRIRRWYNEFNEFEPRFSAGIDLDARFFENIDVVWKEQFRIDAAFEVENSTAIYSGLLRFADLNIVAPNTAYPLFVVAPKERREEVRTQLCRPVFRQLKMDSKVKFLPYEAIEDVDKLFSNVPKGMNIDILEGKAEKLPC
jgi:hypothetical protein